MKFQPHNMWQQSAIAEANKASENAAHEASLNTPKILACMNEHSPCTMVFLTETLGMDMSRVSATIATGVRAKRIAYELRKVQGFPRRVKFYFPVQAGFGANKATG